MPKVTMKTEDEIQQMDVWQQTAWCLDRVRAESKTLRQSQHRLEGLIDMLSRQYRGLEMQQRQG